MIPEETRVRMALFKYDIISIKKVPWKKHPNIPQHLSSPSK